MLWYLATPYRAHPDGLEQAFVDAKELSARLIDMGFEIYSPIVHSHPIAPLVQSADPNSDFWLERQLPMMHAAWGIIIAKLPGWETSSGMKFELAFFRDAGKQMAWVDPLSRALVLESGP